MNNLGESQFADIAGDTDWFSQRYAAIEKTPRITVQTRGNAATMNSAAVAALDNPDTIQLGYSHKHRAIVIRKCEPGLKGAYPLRYISTRSGTRIFAFRAFATQNDIPVGEIKAFSGHAYDGVLIFPLNQEGDEAAGNDDQHTGV